MLEYIFIGFMIVWLVRIDGNLVWGIREALEPAMELQSEVSLLSNSVRGNLPCKCYILMCYMLWELRTYEVTGVRAYARIPDYVRVDLGSRHAITVLFELSLLA